MSGRRRGTRTGARLQCGIPEETHEIDEAPGLDRLGVDGGRGRRGRTPRGRGRRAGRLRDRALGRPALLGPPGPGRRPQPDRGHEPPAAQVHGPRRRPEGRQRQRGLPHPDDVRRRPLCPGAGLLRRAAGAGDPDARRQRLDGLRPAVERRLQLARAARARARGVLLRRPLARAAPHPHDRAAGAAVPRHIGQRSLCREPPLARRRGHLRDARHPGLLQQPVRHGARSTGVGGQELGEHRLAAGDLRGSPSGAARLP